MVQVLDGALLWIGRRVKPRYCRYRDRVLEEGEAAGRLARIAESTAVDPVIEELVRGVADDWCISPEMARLLARMVRHLRCANVLEFGAGLSSLVLATSLARQGGGRLTSIEQSPAWCQDYWTRVEGVSGVDSLLVESRPRMTVGKGGVYHSFKSAVSTVARRGPYDLVLIDAPQSHYGRDGSLSIALKNVAPGAPVLLDDAGRSAEKWTLYRWLKTYTGLRLAYYDPGFGRRGIAILQCTGSCAGRLNREVLLSSLYHFAKCWLKRRRLRKESGDHRGGRVEP